MENQVNTLQVSKMKLRVEIKHYENLYNITGNSDHLEKYLNFQRQLEAIDQEIHQLLCHSK